MGPEAQNLWDWIEQMFLGDVQQSNWGDNAVYPYTVDEDHVDEMVKAIFGGYREVITFTNGSTLYKLKALPLQNKFDRANHAYQTYRGTENMVNIVAWPARGGRNAFNLHISVRRLASAIKARQRQQNRQADPGEWQTAV